MLTDLGSVFNRYARDEGDEFDVIRMCQVAARRGIILRPLEAMIIWQWYSENRYSAAWIAMDDNGISRAIDEFLSAYGDSSHAD